MATISPELQDRINRFAGQSDMEGPVSNREMDALLGAQPNITPAMASQLKGQISNREMDSLLNSQVSNRELERLIKELGFGGMLDSQPQEDFITLTNGSDTRTFRRNEANYPEMMELLNQGYYEARVPSVIKNPDPAQELQERLQGLGLGEMLDPQQDMMPNQSDPAQELQEAIEGLQIQKSQTSDPDEIKALNRMIEVAMVGANAPLSQMALEMQAQGRGEDTALAHLRPGEVILPPEAFEDEAFERAVNRKFEDLGIDPEEAVAGVGIASLNPMTGLEEFGFFKKLAKGIKKIAKKIAPIAGPLANFIPGVGPILAGVIGAATNVVGGKGLKGAISGGLGGWGAGKLMGGIGSLGKVGGNLVGKGGFQNLGFVDKFRALGSGAKAGIGSLFGGGAGPPGTQGTIPGDGLELIDMSTLPSKRGVSDGAGNFFSNLISGGGADNIGNYGMLGDVAGGFTDRLGLTNYGTGQQQQLYDAQGNPVQTRSGGFMGGLGGGLGSLAMAGVPAYMLGKMAYDEAKADKGVPLTPLTTMGPTGRYNIEAEIARRMGTQTPDPVEFGLLPHGTFPELSGGRPMAAAGGGAVYPMAYANGGDVAMEDFQRMNGGVNGPGTETSDDVPAMLSDGEFVFTGEAVRGAGSFDMNKQGGGILTLTPTGTPDRERGTNLMYEMQNLFGSYASA
jgi:hypothetical protein